MTTAPLGFSKDQLVEQTRSLNDGQIWLLALTFVAFAGERAQKIGRVDIEDVCVEFTHAMNDLVGTPDVNEISVQ